MRGWAGASAALGILASVSLAGCAAPQLVEPTINPAQGKAHLAVRRDSQIYGSALTWTVTFDGQPIARLRSGESANIEVPTGVHVLGLTCGGSGLLGASDESSIPFERDRSYEVAVFTTLRTPCQIRLRGVR